MDIKNIAQNPSYKKFKHIDLLFKRIRAEPGFTAALSTIHQNYYAQAVQSISETPLFLASLDVIATASKEGDLNAIIAVLKSMAKRGDGKAAQSIVPFIL